MYRAYNNGINISDPIELPWYFDCLPENKINNNNYLSLPSMEESYQSIINNNPIKDAIKENFKNNKSKDVKEALEKIDSVSVNVLNDIKSIAHEDYLMAYDPSDNKIFIDYNSPYLKSAIKHDCFAFLMIKLGIEYCHLIQNAFSNLSKESIEELDSNNIGSMIKEMQENKDTKDRAKREKFEIENTLNYFGANETFSKVFSEVVKNSLDKCLKYTDKNEIRTQLFGIYFAKEIISSSLENTDEPLTKKYLLDQLDLCDTIFNNAHRLDKKEITKASFLLQQYKQTLSEFSNEDILDLAKKEDKTNWFNMSSLVGRQILKSKSSDEIKSLFYCAVENKSSEVVYWITSYLADYPELKDLKEDITNYILIDKDHSKPNKDWSICICPNFFDKNTQLKFISSDILRKNERDISLLHANTCILNNTLNNDNNFDKETLEKTYTTIINEYQKLKDSSDKTEKISPNALMNCIEMILPCYNQKDQENLKEQFKDLKSMCVEDYYVSQENKYFLSNYDRAKQKSDMEK